MILLMLFLQNMDFNSTVVQLEAYLSCSICTARSDFNSTVVQLEVPAKGLLPPSCRHFNSTVVQLEVYREINECKFLEAV